MKTCLYSKIMHWEELEVVKRGYEAWQTKFYLYLYMRCAKSGAKTVILPN